MRSNGSKSLREHGYEGVALREGWSSAVKHQQIKVASRLERMALKDQQIKTYSPVTVQDLETQMKQLTDIFPGINLNNLTKHGLTKNKA